MLFSILMAVGCGGGGNYVVGPGSVDMATPGGTGQARVKWTVNGSSTSTACPRVGTYWWVLVDGAIAGTHSFDCYQDAWDSGILSVSLGSHQFTVQAKDGAGTLFGTKTATAMVVTTDPNTVVAVGIAFTSADF
jgi:hypothetical protein